METSNLTTSSWNLADYVDGGGEGARRGQPHAKALGDRAHHLLQPVGRRLVTMWRLEIEQRKNNTYCCRRCQQQAGQVRQTRLLVDAHHPGHRKNDAQPRAGWRLGGRWRRRWCDKDWSAGGAGLGKRWQNTLQSAARNSKLAANVTNRTRVHVVFFLPSPGANLSWQISKSWKHTQWAPSMMSKVLVYAFPPSETFVYLCTGSGKYRGTSITAVSPSLQHPVLFSVWGKSRF